MPAGSELNVHILIYSQYRTKVFLESAASISPGRCQADHLRVWASA